MLPFPLGSLGHHLILRFHAEARAAFAYNGTTGLASILLTRLSHFQGCTVDIEEPDLPYADMKNSNILNVLYKKHATSLGIKILEVNDFPEHIKSMAASTDMGNVSYVKPSIHPIFKIGNAMNHTEEFTSLAGKFESQKPTLDSAKAMMMTGIEVILDKDLLKRVKDEFDSS